MAELTAARKAALMAYCRIDELGPGEDELLTGLYTSAVSYMAQAGISEPAANTTRRAQYELCVNALVLNDWDSRGTVSGTSIQDNPAFRRRLNQLKLTEPLQGGSGVSLKTEERY